MNVPDTDLQQSIVIDESFHFLSELQECCRGFLADNLAVRGPESHRTSRKDRLYRRGRRRSWTLFGCRKQRKLDAWTRRRCHSHELRIWSCQSPEKCKKSTKIDGNEKISRQDLNTGIP